MLISPREEKKEEVGLKGKNLRESFTCGQR